MPPATRTKRNKSSLLPYNLDPPLETENERKRRKRLNLAVLIENIGVTIVECFYYIKNKRKC